MMITDKIQQIAKWTSDSFDKEVNEINKESGEDDFAQIEEMLAEKLPKEFIQIYDIFNGEIGDQFGILFGLELMSTKNIILNLEFALGLVKPTERKIIAPNKSEEILNVISDLYLKSIPNKMKFGFISKKWLKATFECSHESHSGISVEYKNGEIENYGSK